jgi:hypothetical protein
VLLYIASKLVSIVVVHRCIPRHKRVVIKAVGFNMPSIAW